MDARRAFPARARVPCQCRRAAARTRRAILVPDRAREPGRWCLVAGRARAVLASDLVRAPGRLCPVAGHIGLRGSWLEPSTAGKCARSGVANDRGILKISEQDVSQQTN